MDRWAELEAALARQLKGERLRHVYRVLETARLLAARFGADSAKAEEAALLHDFCKQMPGEALLAEARRRGLLVDPAEEAQPHVLHGPVAAALLQEQGLVTDPEVLDAIRWHTTGRPGMGLVEKVVWLADYIEPGRTHAGVDEVRRLAESDLDGALRRALCDTIHFVMARGWPVHLYSVHTWNWLVNHPTV